MAGRICKKKCSILAVFAVVAIAVAIWFVLFGTSSLINKENVQAQLQEISAQLAAEAKNSGKEASLTYGEIGIEGWGYNKRAVVHGLTLSLADSGAPEAAKWVFATDNVKVALDQANPKRVIIGLAGPVNVSQNSQLKAVIGFPAPLNYSYLDSQTNGARMVRHELLLPQSISVAEPALAADSSGPDGASAMKSTVISYKPNPVVRLDLSPEQGIRHFEYAFSDILISGDAGALVTVAAIDSRFDEAPSAEGRVAGSYRFGARDIVLLNNGAPTKPYALTLDLAFDGEKPPQSAASGVLPLYKADLTLNEASLASSDFALRASGKLAADPEDPLWSGEVKLDVDNVQQFLASEIVPLPARGAVEASLEKLSGQKLAGVAQVSIPLKREKNGVFYVGQTTFEAFVTSFFAELLKQTPATVAAPTPAVVPAPEQPAAMAPAAGTPPVPAPAPTPAPAPAAPQP